MPLPLIGPGATNPRYREREPGINYPDISPADLAMMNPIGDSGFISDPKFIGGTFKVLPTIPMSKAAEATIFETSIADTVSTGDGESVAAPGVSLTPVIMIGGLLLLLYLMTKRRF